jgi:hypothetical protein
MTISQLTNVFTLGVTPSVIWLIGSCYSDKGRDIKQHICIVPTEIAWRELHPKQTVWNVETTVPQRRYTLNTFPYGKTQKTQRMPIYCYDNLPNPDTNLLRFVPITLDGYKTKQRRSRQRFCRTTLTSRNYLRQNRICPISCHICFILWHKRGQILFYRIYFDLNRYYGKSYVRKN